MTQSVPCRPALSVKVIAVLICLFAFSIPPVRAQANKTLPPYTSLSDEAIVKMGLSEFQWRYGKDSVGEAADNLLYIYAAAFARTNDRAARRISPAAAKEIAALRSRLRNWDAARFTPSEEYVGGRREASHRDASDAFEREEMLKSLLPFLGVKTKTRKTGSEERKARAAFRKWLAQSAEDAVPLRDQMDGEDAEGRANLRLSYAAWYTNLKTLARGIESATLRLPSPVAARLLDYACHL